MQCQKIYIYIYIYNRQFFKLSFDLKVIINKNNNSEFEKKTCICLYLFGAVQEHGLSGTNYVKRHINQIADLLLCRMCDKRGERVSPSESEKLPRRNRKKQDNVAKTVHFKSSE